MDISGQLGNFRTQLISHQKCQPCDDNLLIHGPRNSAITFSTSRYKYGNGNVCKELVQSITFLS